MWSGERFRSALAILAVTALAATTTACKKNTDVSDTDASEAGSAACPTGRLLWWAWSNRHPLYGLAPRMRLHAAPGVVTATHREDSEVIEVWTFDGNGHANRLTTEALTTEWLWSGDDVVKETATLRSDYSYDGNGHRIEGLTRVPGQSEDVQIIYEWDGACNVSQEHTWSGTFSVYYGTGTECDDEGRVVASGASDLGQTFMGDWDETFTWDADRPGPSTRQQTGIEAPDVFTWQDDGALAEVSYGCGGLWAMTYDDSGTLLTERSMACSVPKVIESSWSIECQ